MELELLVLSQPQVALVDIMVNIMEKLEDTTELVEVDMTVDMVELKDSGKMVDTVELAQLLLSQPQVALEDIMVEIMMDIMVEIMGIMADMVMQMHLQLLQRELVDMADTMENTKRNLHLV